MVRSSLSHSPQALWRPGLPTYPSARLWAASALHAAGTRLQRAANLLLAPLCRRPAAPASWPLVEFHAEAGAPEGALFIDGEYVGTLGVSRL